MPKKKPHSSTPSPAPESASADLPPNDSLDGLAELATQLAPCLAALLLEATALGHRIVGSHGLTPAQAASLLSMTSSRQASQPETDPGDGSGHGDTEMAVAVAGMEGTHASKLRLPAAGGHLGGWLVLVHKVRGQNETGHASQLAPLTRQAAAQLRALAQRAERYLLNSQASGERSAVEGPSESESRLNLTERTAGVGSWSIDLASQAMHHSEGCINILGLRETHTESELEFMISRYAPEWRDAMRQRLERCATLGEGFDEEIQVVLPESGVKWVRTVGDAVRDPKGQVIRIQGAVQDISAQKQAQQETMRLAMRLTTTLASITEAFVTLDRQCCFTYLNQESERLLQKTTARSAGPGGLARTSVTPWLFSCAASSTNALKTNRRVELEATLSHAGQVAGDARLSVCRGTGGVFPRRHRSATRARAADAAGDQRGPAQRHRGHRGDQRQHR